MFRYLVIAAALLIVRGDAGAQGWRELYHKADSLFAIGFGPAVPQALTAAQEALSLLEAEYGTPDTSITPVLDLLASILSSATIVRPQDALALSLRSLTIKEAAFGTRDPRVADALCNLSEMYLSMRRPVDAKAVLDRALRIFEVCKATARPTYGFSLHNMAYCYFAQGDYAKAVHFYIRALDTLRSVMPAGHPSLAYTLTMLAITYQSLGSFDEAEPLLEEALQNWKSHYGPRSIQTRIVLGNLTEHFRQQGRFAEAEARARREQPVDADTLQPNDPMQGRFLIVQGNRLMSYGRYGEALIPFARAVDIWRDAAEPQAHTVLALRLMGECNLHLRRFAQAESLFAEALAMADTLWNEEPVREVESRLGLIRCYMRTGRHAAASALLRHVLTTEESRLTSYNPMLADVLDTYTEYWRRARDYRQALVTAERAVAMRMKNFQRNVRVLSEQSANEYAAQVRHSIDGYLSATVDRRIADGSVPMKVADVILTTKGQTTEQSLLRRRRLVRETDSATVALAEEYRRVRFRIATQYVNAAQSVSEGRSLPEMDSLEVSADRLEAMLARRSVSFARGERELDVTVQEVCRRLPDSAVVVEFFSFGYRRLVPDTTVACYLALVLSRDGAIRLVDLGEADRIDRHVEVYRKHLARLAESGRPASHEDEAAYRAVASRLYELIWKPLRLSTEGGGAVFIAPDGGLHLLSFAGLADEEGRYLIERHPLHYLSAARDVIRMDSVTASGSGLLALGDPDFDATAVERIAIRPPDALVSATRDLHQLRNLRSGCDQLKTLSVARLNSTREEVRAITDAWGRRYGLGTSVSLIGVRASEEEFKARTPGRRVIHLATHGYFLDASCFPSGSGAFGNGENPLLTSGVLLAGANLHGKGSREAGSEDGVLTALEVSTLELHGVDLVVLSACETGLGSVTQGEGVYGLRRAFQMAGARTVVSTLWKVPDVESTKFMRDLYAAMATSGSVLTSGTSYPLLMQQVALRRIAEQRRRGRPAHPFTWGAYLATGDWKMR